MARRIGLLDPAGRLAGEVAAAAAALGVVVVDLAAGPGGRVDAILLAPGAADELPAPGPGEPLRWIVGESGATSRLAGAAARARAAGVLLTPVGPEGLSAALAAEVDSAEVELARARRLIATSLVDVAHSAVETLRALAEAFAGQDCVVWWRDGEVMTPTMARPEPAEGYRGQIASAARVAAACGGTVILGGPAPRAVIAEALRSSPTEVSGMVAVICDAPRRFAIGERVDLRALATRLTSELAWQASHRRLVAEGERLSASSLLDPLTGAMTRAAFEQAVAHELAAAGRREEPLSVAIVDVVGLRGVNRAHGHRVGDEVLAQLAARLRAGVRGNDALGRVRGDEFALALVGADARAAEPTMRKLLARILVEPLGAESAKVELRLRAAVSEIAAGERSAAAAIARCYAVLRATAPGEVAVAAVEARPADDDEPSDGGLAAGTILGGSFRILHELSRGAMGVVYRGEDLGLGRQVAIKVLRSDLASNRELVEGFRAEAATLASLHHENLVQVYALGEHAGEVYFAMELVEGEPLAEVLRATLDRGEHLPLAAITQITTEIADALDAMHALGLVHRDVKPGNVLLDRERDRAVLVDVGVAVRAGDSRDVAGTPGFAAPEAFLEARDAPTGDVYGLAATAYCMLTGRPPFGTGPAQVVVLRQLHQPLTPASLLRPGLTPAVDEVLAKGLTPTAKRRWSSASTFAIALQRALGRADDAGGPRPAGRPHATDVIEEQPGGFAPPPGSPSPPGSSPSSPPSSPPPRPATRHDEAQARSTAAGRVRAAHARILARLFHHHLGDAGMARLAAEQPRLAGALAADVAPLGWIPLGDLGALLELALHRLPGRQVARQVGRGTISASFARMLGADPAALSPEAVLRSLPSFWRKYHDWGDVAVTVGPGRAEVVLDGAPGSTEICALVAAELERIVELTGARAVTAAHPRCGCLGAPPCAFDLTWGPAA